jgi:hypothetical protein
MSYKRATVRLFVALTGLFASVLELLGATIRLVTSAIRLATTCLERHEAAPTRHRELLVEPTAALGPSQEEKLANALSGLGFRAGQARAFAVSVRGRQDPINMLVKEGIVALSSN